MIELLYLYISKYIQYLVYIYIIHLFCCNIDEPSTMTHCKFHHEALLEAVIQMDLEIRRKHCGSSEEGRAL